MVQKNSNDKMVTSLLQFSTNTPTSSRPATPERPSQQPGPSTVRRDSSVNAKKYSSLVDDEEVPVSFFRIEFVQIKMIYL